MGLIDLSMAIIAATAYMAIGVRLADKMEEIGKVLIEANPGIKLRSLAEHEYYLFIALWPAFMIIGFFLNIFSKRNGL